MERRLGAGKQLAGGLAGGKRGDCADSERPEDSRARRLWGRFVALSEKY